jgi:hypothetical protein
VVLCAAGLVSVFRAVALIVSTSQNMLWPVAVALAGLFPGCCGVAYCFLAVRVAGGSRLDLSVSVAASATLFVPYLLLGPFEIERGPAYTEALDQVPAGPLLGRVLYGAQMTALAAHSVLLGWVIVAGLRLRRSLPTRDEPGSRPARPSLGANLLLVFVGFVVGYLWNIGSVFLAEQLGLRGQMTSTEWGPMGGSNDALVVGVASLLFGMGLIGWQIWSRWRWWGLVAGGLAGLALSFVAVSVR